MNDRLLRKSGLFSVLNVSCTTFGIYDGVKWSFKRWNICNGEEITLIFRQYRRMIVFCDLLVLSRRLIQHAPRSTRKIQQFVRLNVEIARSGRKLWSFAVKIRWMMAFCEKVGSFRYRMCRALHLACNREWTESLNGDISPTGRKLRTFFVKIDEWSRLAICWSSLDA
jgi:hypothetical protein